MVLPPNLAPIQVVIIPIYKGKEQLERIALKVEEIRNSIISKGISVKFDHRDTHKPGWKFAEYELKGVPLRIAIGPKDLDNGTLEIARRDTKEKKSYPMNGIEDKIQFLLKEIQSNIYRKAQHFKEENTHQVNNYDEFKKLLDNKGGFIYAHWDGTPETENLIKEETKATVRCIPLDGNNESGRCMVTGKPSSRRVLFAKAY